MGEAWQPTNLGFILLSRPKNTNNLFTQYVTGTQIIGIPATNFFLNYDNQ